MNNFYSNSIKNTSTTLRSFGFLMLVLFANIASAQTTLFQFNFENNITASIDNVVGTPAYTNNGITGTAFTTATPCQGARMYTAANWDTGDYHRFTVNTTGYANMNFSFCNRADNIAIGTFLIRVSSNSGTSWDTVLANYTPTTNNNTLVTATFPTTANNSAEIWIEISKVSGANNARTLIIDSATLTGYAIPTIANFTPSGGCSNPASVVITGTNFTGVTAVRFGGTNATSFVVNSSTQITATPAASTSGAISVTTAGGTAISGTNFIVNPVPTITPNRVNETCPESNNGTISPTISGGLSNIRYIRLTQKYVNADAWQQVAEIEAYEIFTGTNVARSSNGATASTTSVYSGLYPASSAIDGNNSGNNNFWHSASPNIDEFITVDLQSGKNIDYLRIYNRTDCCAQRGQNMLLELFDASNTLVFSRTIDLYQSNTVTSVTVNILDVAWADGATTLNRTALDSGTYTLNYADAISCSVSSPINITAINPTSVGGTVSGGTTPICQGSSTGTLTLSGQVGTVIQWDKRLNGGSWGYAGGSTTTFSEVPYAAGTWEYRALVQSGSCTSAFSSIQTIVVSSTPVGGYVEYAAPICFNSLATLNLIGSSGTIVRWEKRLSPSTTWISVNNTNTILNEIPSSAGTWEYRAIVGNGNCTEVASSPVNLFVNPELTITLSNTNATICQTTTTASFNYSATTGSPANWVVNFDSAAISAGFGSPQNNSVGTSGTITVNVPYNVAAGTYNGSLTVITYFPSCSSTTYPITVTVGLSTPTVGIITDPTCTTSGSVVLSGLPFPGTLNQTGTVSNSYPTTGTTMTITGLAGGTYNFSASNGSCSSSATGNIVINSIASNTWNGAAWSNGTPSASQALIFNGNYPPAINPNVDITGCSCTVNTGRNVIINPERTLTITNSVTVSGTGTLTFEDTASLVQINDSSVNSGNIIYKRSTTNVISSDYTYWSSPVANQNLNISPSYSSGLYYSYNDFATPENWKQESLATVMAVGKGYIMRGTLSPTPPPPSFYTGTFTGVPNNAIPPVPIGPTGVSVLLGNPYPSALDADTFLDYNAAVLEGTIYFWTHKTAIQAASNITDGTAGSGIYAYTSNDYAAYNSVGGVGSGSPSASGSLTPSGKIAAGQSFFGTSKATGSSVVFNNSMRVAANNTQFFRTKNDTKNKTITREKHRIWLDVSNDKGAFKQTLIGYITDATNNYEDRFDGITFDGNEFIDFYSINQDKKLVIQGRALPFDENDEVPLGFKTAITGAFTININHVDGLLTNQEVFLEDKLTNTVSNLKTGNYTFNTNAGTFNDRFVLKFTNKTLGTGDFDASKKQVVVSLKNKQIKINSFTETIAKVAIYDLSGKLIYQKTNVNTNELVLIDFTTKEQALIVKTTLENGTIVNNKIIY